MFSFRQYNRVSLFFCVLWTQIAFPTVLTTARKLVADDDTRAVSTAQREQQTKEAIQEGLGWLASQQREDGSWTFVKGPDPGTLDAPIAATSLALMPFLFSENTHKKGTHQAVVQKGLDFLTRQINAGENGADMRESGATMYGHGLAAIALCEAYARSSDRALREPAQQVVDFIVYAQDPIGGGWRYLPRQAGDTSVMGWQLTALKVAKSATLTVPDQTFQLANRFLDSVQSEGGSAFRYTTKGAGIRTTSVGLLSRLYLGADAQSPAIENGVAKALKHGPREGDVYFNYITTSLMREADGKPRIEWNDALRDLLVDSQEDEGSWSFHDAYFSQRAGRIGVTSMCLSALTIANE